MTANPNIDRLRELIGPPHLGGYLMYHERIHNEKIRLLDALAAELDAAQQEIRRLDHDAATWQADFREAENRAEKLEAALRGLVEHIDLNGGCHRGCPEHEEARAALAADAADTKEGNDDVA